MPRPSKGWKKFTVNLPPELILEVKKRALEEDSSPGEILTKAYQRFAPKRELNRSQEQGVEQQTPAIPRPEPKVEAVPPQRKVEEVTEAEEMGSGRYYHQPCGAPIIIAMRRVEGREVPLFKDQKGNRVRTCPKCKGVLAKGPFHKKVK